MNEDWLPAPPRWVATVWHCHRIPERCFHWRGRPQWLCARCVGVLAGMTLAAASVPATLVWSPLFVRNLHWLLLFAGAGVASCTADWSLQTWANVPSTNVRRFWTGLAGGMAIVALVEIVIVEVWRSLGAQ